MVPFPGEIYRKKKHKRWKMGWGLCSYTAIRNSVTKQHCKQTNKEP